MVSELVKGFLLCVNVPKMEESWIEDDDRSREPVRQERIHVLFRSSTNQKMHSAIIGDVLTR
jgi:hypothetical protein